MDGITENLPKWGDLTNRCSGLSTHDIPLGEDGEASNVQTPDTELI